MFPVHSFSRSPPHQSDHQFAPTISPPILPRFPPVRSRLKALVYSFNPTPGALELTTPLRSYGGMIILDGRDGIFVLSWDRLGASLCVWYRLKALFRVFLMTPHSP